MRWRFLYTFLHLHTWHDINQQTQCDSNRIHTMKLRLASFHHTRDETETMREVISLREETEIKMREKLLREEMEVRYEVREDRGTKLDLNK